MEVTEAEDERFARERPLTYITSITFITYITFAHANRGQKKTPSF